MSNAATAAVRATCHVKSGTDGAPLVTLSLDIASWIIPDHDHLNEEHLSSMRRRIRAPSSAWAPGSALDLPEEVVPVAWPSLLGVYFAVANQVYRRRSTRDGAQRIMRNSIATVNGTEFRVVCLMLVHGKPRKEVPRYDTGTGTGRALPGSWCS